MHYGRQPTELDYADPTKFKFSITKLPKVEFFTTQCKSARHQSW